MGKFANATANVNIYNILGKCWQPTAENQFYSSNELGFSVIGGQIKTYKKGWSQKDYTPWAFKHQEKAGVKVIPPCVNGA